MPEAAPRPRSPAIDYLKAAAIVTVVWIHAFADPWNLEALQPFVILVNWAVPAFFFASGYLRHHAAPVSGATLGRWLVRLLVPYVIATVLAVLYRRHVLHQNTLSLAFNLATGAGWPIYYFVPVLAGAYVLAAALSRAPRAALPLFVLIAPVVPLGVDPFPRHLGLFWIFRSPFMWWGYVLLGWLAADAAPRLARVPAGRRHAAAAVAAALFLAIAAVCWLPGSWRGLVWPPIVAANYAFLVAAFLFVYDAPARPLVRRLADASYPIYLYHFFFTSAVRTDLLRLGELAEPAAFAAGLVGSLGVVVLGRRLLGARARLVLG
ncbi:MAG TPA: acyltransferase [Candidatus Limnocylindria bacterium]|nr:acyltransferase [Candidatus Limnocylindria bacterium]